MTNVFLQGKIYRMKAINATDPSECYIGSTCATLRQRKMRHEMASHYKPNMAIYTHFNKVGWDKVIIELLEPIRANNKKELHYAERRHIDLHKPTLNRVIPTRSIYEYNRLPSTRAKKSALKDCVCGCAISSRHMAEHRRTPKHQKKVAVNIVAQNVERNP